MPLSSLPSLLLLFHYPPAAFLLMALLHGLKKSCGPQCPPATRCRSGCSRSGQYFRDKWSVQRKYQEGTIP
ncbi:hypothetical protein GQ55_9G226100 [Panicum hallii var. hallii]|uniref:Secreted protein n=1 Tax=Panicum hallii var. hallii TaxID=1504633 RepID=A0A2T7C663_9POAL|nr:hypothetical protein GQ55_9G226100 [Panicum hallii var. hallii]